MFRNNVNTTICARYRMIALLCVFALLFNTVGYYATAEAPAQTYKVLTCTMEEHAHTDACYEERLVCGLEEEPPEKRFVSIFKTHMHTKECYDSNGIPVCGYAENVYYHTHNQYCKDDDGNIVCGLNTSSPHTHTDDCYKTDRVLDCGKEENEEHKHTKECYKETKTLVCDKPTETHVHTKECWDANGNAICGKLEVPTFESTKDSWYYTGHTHTDSCYAMFLTCGKQEHTHTAECYTEISVQAEHEPKQPDEEDAPAEPQDAQEPASGDEGGEQPTEGEKPAEEPENAPEEDPSVDDEENGDADLTDSTPWQDIPVEEEDPDLDAEDNQGDETPAEEPADIPADTDVVNDVDNVHTEIEDTSVDTDADNVHTDTDGTPADESVEAPVDNGMDNVHTETEEDLVDEPEDAGVDNDMDNVHTEEEAHAGTTNTDIILTDTDNVPEVPSDEEPEDGGSVPTDNTPAGGTAVEEAQVGDAPADETPVDTDMDYVHTETEEQTADETADAPADTGMDNVHTDTEETTAETDDIDTLPVNPADSNVPAGENVEDEPVDGEIQADDENADEEGTEEDETVIEENIDLTEEPSDDTAKELADEPAEEPKVPELVYELMTEDGYKTTVQADEENGFFAGTWIQVLEGVQETVSTSAVRVLPADASGKVTVYRRALEITLLYDNELVSVNPETKYKVAIELPDLHGITNVKVYKGEGEDAERLNSTANNRGVVTFYTSGFGVFSFVAEAEESDTKDTQCMATALYGETEYVHIAAGKAPKGMTVIDTVGAEANANAWICIHITSLPEMEEGTKVSLYSVEDGQLDELLREDFTTEETLLVSLARYTGFALVMDSGLTQRTETTGDVTVYGMLPNNGVLNVADVRDAYAGFAPVSGRNIAMLAAYDITITNEDGEFQPTGKTVKVTILNAEAAEAIQQGREVRLWHIDDDGTVMEIQGFGQGENGEIVFYANGFSVYIITSTIESYSGSYEFALASSGEILLSDLLGSLHMTMPDLYTTMAEDEYPVLGTPEVSNTELLEIAPVTDDNGTQVNWLLRRLQAFASAETLTVPASNGDTLNITVTDEQIINYVIVAENDGYKVTAEFDQRAEIPEGTQLIVSDVSGEGYEEDAAEALNLAEGEEFLYAKTLDISFVYEGEVIEPKAEVRITVELADLDNGIDSMRIVHFAEDGAEEVENNINNNEISFASDSFSRYTFGTVLKTIAEDKDEQASISLMAFKQQEITIQQPETELEEGLEVIKAVGVTASAEDEPLYVKAEWETPENPMESLYLGDLANNAEILTAESGSVLPLDTSDVAIIKDTGYRRQELTAVVNDSEILLSGLLPRDSGAEAADVTEDFEAYEYVAEDAEKPAASEPGRNRTTVAAFDIAIKPAEEFVEILGEKFEPDAEHPVHVEINDPRITGLAAYELWHIKDNGEKELVESFEVESGKVIFDAEEFSVYTIAEVEIRDSNKAQTINDLRQGEGFKISITGSSSGTFYALNQTNTSQANHVLISQTKNADAATEWFFEENQNGTWSIYWKDGSDVKHYIHIDQQYPTKFSFSTTDPAEFHIDLYNNTPGGFYIYQEPNYSFNLKGNGTKGGFQLYPANNGTNQGSCVELVYTTSQQDALIEQLDGKSFGLMAQRTVEGTVTGYAVMADNQGNNANHRLSQQLLVRTDPTDKVSMLYVANNAKITFWTFTHEHDDLFSLSTKIDGVTYYLRADTGDKLTITDTKDSNCEFRVIPGTGAYYGRLRLYNPTAGVAIRMSVHTTSTGTTINGFGTHASEKSDNTFLYLVDRSSYTDEDFVMYSAEKISVSDENLHTGSQIVLYTRVWDGTKYEFFVVDHDGTLIRAYEDGGSLTWVGRYINTALWDFTEYFYEGTSTPNHYYELQNAYSGKYVAPQVNNGQLFANHTIGINLNGRRYGDYYTKILAWDDPNYDYAGYKADLETGRVVSVPMSQAEDFYFAVVQNDDQLTPVETIHHASYGITMKLVDFSNRSVQDAYLGYMDTSGKKAVTGLLSTDLTNGYPNATYSGDSFASLFSGGYTVDDLFIKNTYYGSGYFMFDSTQNFASLNEDHKSFTVYKELGTIDLATNPRPTVDHGQFMPFNKIYPNRFAINHPYNLTDVYANPLSGDNGRAGERLYKITADEANYYFGVEMTANFMQLPDGKDAWGHDIIFEFTGDDDFWLYVDGELVLDLGGVHSAIGGSVNFSTGVVQLPPSTTNANATTTTLYDIFRNNYMARNPEAAPADVDAYLANKFVLKNGNYIFRNYSTHTMRMFYMERGAGASNLKMRFNLTTAKIGQVELEKAVSGTDKNDFASVEFPFQIYYETNDGLGCTHMITQEHLDDEIFRVVFKNSSEGVPFMENYTVDGVTYNNVFLLKPGQIADITMPTHTMRYKIRECGVNTNIYDTTTINCETPAAEGQGHSNTKWYESTIDTPEDRVKVVFDNHVDPSALRTLSITKLLYDENDTLLSAQQDPTGFRFRVCLGDDLEYYRMGEYYVKDPSGNYCIYNNGFVSTGVANFDDMTEEQKTRATFKTSPSGAVDKIPSQYTVEIRGLLVGTKFKVEERISDMPNGYSYRHFIIEEGGVPTEYVCYRRVEGSYILEEGYSVNSGIIRDNSDPALEIHNRRGWGLTGTKIWSDKDFMLEHGPIYFAVYVGNDMLPGTLRRVNGQSVYYYFDSVEQGYSFQDYKIREVSLSGTVETDDDGYVTSYGTATMMDEDDIIEVDNCRQSSSSNYVMLPYSVSYETGAMNGVSGHENIREDKVTNTRPDGLRIMKTDWDGNPLEGAEFIVKLGDDVIGTYVSDQRGWVTTAYLADGTYTLDETLSPIGYQGLQDTIQFTLQGTTVTVTENPEWVRVEHPANGLVTIYVKNRPVSFKIYKKNPQNLPLEGAHFALYKQKLAANGQLVKDFAPLEGYEDIVSLADGELPGINETLPKGVYYLTEKQAPLTYVMLDEDLCFEIDDLGYIRKISGPGTLTHTEQQSGSMNVYYTINVENEQLITDGVLIRKIVEGDMANQYEDFVFTVVQAPQGQTFVWKKNGVEQPTQIGIGDTFTLRHGEYVQIFIPEGTLLRISEANDTYQTTWKLNGETLTADQSNTVGFSDVGVLEVTNTRTSVAPTGFRMPVTAFAVVLIFGIAFCIVLHVQKKRENREKSY